MKKIRLIFVALWLLVGVVLPAGAQSWRNSAIDTDRHPPNMLMRRLHARIYHMAQQAPKPLDVPGLPNAYQISPRLYRGGQPTAEGYRALAKMGVKVVVSLRRQAPNEKLIEEAGLVSYHIPINPFLFSNKHAQQFLDIMETTDAPVYIHCLYGSDRTGAMVALYRIVYDHWTRQQALREMKQERFGFHPVFANLPQFIEQVQLEKIVATTPAKPRLVQSSYVPSAPINQPLGRP